MDMTGQTAAFLRLSSKAGTPAALTAAQYKAAFSAALATCDVDDGLVDGVMSNPMGCKFDPSALRCGAPTANADSSLCLSSAQVDTLRGLLTGLTLSNGTTVYAGYSWADFGYFSSIIGALGGGFAFLATDDASWLTPQKQATFDLNRDYPVLHAGLLKRGADHDKAAIAAYVASGRKLISWHAGSDSLSSLNDHARNCAAITRLVGTMGVADPRSNTRFFIVPGATHGAGATFAEVDWLSAIIDWVEKDTPPTQLLYDFSAGGATRTLPVCEYPSYPRYNGTGDRNSSSSFTCTAP
jgi:feruloyl esterase